MVPVVSLQTTTDVVLAVEFHPTDPNTIVTCGKFHIFFWAWNGNSLLRKQGLFGVSRTQQNLLDRPPYYWLKGFCTELQLMIPVEPVKPVEP